MVKFGTLGWSFCLLSILGVSVARDPFYSDQPSSLNFLENRFRAPAITPEERLPWADEMLYAMPGAFSLPPPPPANATRRSRFRVGPACNSDVGTPLRPGDARFGTCGPIAPAPVPAE